jgi:hypothetical protein
LGGVFDGFPHHICAHRDRRLVRGDALRPARAQCVREAQAETGCGRRGAADKDKPYGDWKKVTKDAEVMQGFFTLYKKRENLYLEIAPDQMGKPVLGIFSLARGIGSKFLLGGLPLNDHVFQFERNGDYVMVLEENTSS